MKKKIIIGIGFFVAGILCTCFFGYEYFSEYGFLNVYHLESFANNRPELPILFSNILWERGKLFGVIWLVSMTPARKIEPAVLRCVICFVAGVFLVACAGNLGIGGLLFFAAAFLPHGPVYLAALILMFCFDRSYPLNGRKLRWKKIAIYAAIISSVLLGCVLEAAVGTQLLGFVISLVT
jgi:hypothetical protein